MVRGIHGGIYKLQNVYINTKEFCDIEIMIDFEANHEIPGFDRLREWHDQFA